MYIILDVKIEMCIILDVKFEEVDFPQHCQSIDLVDVLIGHLFGNVLMVWALLAVHGNVLELVEDL